MVVRPDIDCRRLYPHPLTRLAVWLFAALMVAGCTEFDYDSDRELRRMDRVIPAEQVHVVQRGDTLYQIAWQHGLDFRDLARWNNIDSPFVIYPGQQLALSSAGGSGEAASAAPTAARSAGTTSAASSDAASGPIAWRWPLEGDVVRSFNANADGKRGISIQAEPGAEVVSAADGRVVYSGDGLRGYGNLVIVKHNDRFLTAYGYNRELLVGEGDRVSGGQAIARVGNTAGREGQLHFEVRQQGSAVNPASYLP
ncbi:peptidoglycan DD-metalloendopeptidase family protein [Spiribacter sp. 2438]|uniref:peptidoglycan DD-metalloendopeptidase family protein n=1 Tax=Spiribacter sp. 2438 TaxID=2666185 RepID=UPI001E2BDE69|nr:peptidoglycan DD-metalloendopeptidase family protein [Spiribacter sp. 2438]